MSKKQEKPKVSDGERVAFVISPIGDPGSHERKRADQILNHIIEPVVSELGYKAVRADTISKPGVITSQIISHLLNDPLVIADLTGQNPNVFYELAVRHTVGKATIQMIQEGERIPFDVSTTRTIQINHQDLDSVDKGKKELRKQIEAVEKNPTLVDSPISMTVDLQALRQSSNPQSKAMADLRMTLEKISFMVEDIHHRRMEEPKSRADLVVYETREGVRLERTIPQLEPVWKVRNLESDAVITFNNEMDAKQFFRRMLSKVRERKKAKSKTTRRE